MDLSDVFSTLGIDGGAEHVTAEHVTATRMEYRWCAARLGGRARSGSDSSGKLVHAVWTNTLVGDIDFSTAACGARPGRTSYGFTVDVDTTTVTCPLCRRKLGLK